MTYFECCHRHINPIGLSFDTVRQRATLLGSLISYGSQASQHVCILHRLIHQRVHLLQYRAWFSSYDVYKPVRHLYRSHLDRRKSPRLRTPHRLHHSCEVSSTACYLIYERAFWHDGPDPPALTSSLIATEASTRDRWFQWYSTLSDRLVP